MGFSAADAVKPLEYKGMAGYGIPDGVITEPSIDAISAFLTSIHELAKEPAEGETAIPEEEIFQKIYGSTADLCSGTPSAEQLRALPARVFKAFVQWLSSEFIDPKD